MKTLGTALLCGASLMTFAPAYAQTTAAPSAASNTGLQEIVVTAQRKSENLMAVPLAITASTGTQLQASGIKEISALQFTTPGFLPNNGVGYTQLYVRGIGNSIYVGADPSVVTNIDDIPRIYGSMVNTFFNVERVEVLKGAQGGLYGRNATGGVVNIITRQPSDKFEMDGRVSYGTKNTFSGAGYVNVPLTDAIAWNLSVQRDSHNNYVKNLATANPLTAAMFPNGGGPLLGTVGVVTPAQTAAFFNSAINPPKGYGNKNFWAVDSKLRVNFTDNFKITIDGDYSKKRDSDGNQWISGQPAFTQAAAAGILANFGVDTAFPAGFFKSNTGKFTTYNTTPAPTNLTDYGVSAKAELTLSGFDITNSFAYRHQTTLYDQNYGGPITIDVPDVRNKKHYIYDELRAVSTGSGPFHFLAGVTYLKTQFSGLTVNELFPPIPTVPAVAFLRSVTASTDSVENWSIYGQAGYDITDALSLTVSGRYIHETNNGAFTLPLIAETSIGAKKFLPSATLSYKLSNSGNIYVRYAKGFKAGGVNPVVPPSEFPTSAGSVFGPEQVDTYEAGFKDSLFDHKVQVSTAIFYNNYKGLQTQVVGNAAHPELIEGIINVGSARTYGAEASVTWRVVSPLTISANAAYLNARYKKFANTDGSVFSTFDYSHQQMIYAPKWQLGFTGDLDQPLNDRLHLTAHGLLSYISDVRGGLASIPGLPDPIIKAYWLANMRVGVKTADDRYELSVFADNLFDKGYFTFASAGSFSNNFVWGNPRIVGVELAFKFH